MDFLIKMLEKFSFYLKKKKESNEVANHWILAFIFSVIPVLIFTTILINEEPLIWIITLIISIIFLYSFFRIYKEQWHKHFFITFFPFAFWFFWILLLSVTFLIDNGSLIREKSSLIILSFLIFSPLIYISQYHFKIFQNKFFDKIKSIMFLYNSWFFFFIALNVLLLISFNTSILNIFPITDFFWETIEWPWYIDSFLVWIYYIFILWFTVLLPIYILKNSFDYIEWSKRKGLNIWIFLFFIVFIFASTSPLNYFYNYQIKRAYKIIQEWWNNYESYSDAKVWFLDSAFLSKIKNWEYINVSLFQKLYDSTPEEYFWEKLWDKIQDRNSFATNMSKTWENAKVILSLWEIENNLKILDNNWVENTNFSWKLNALETTYRFNFENESNENQEVVIFFETPSKNSVVTGLKLGLDLELVWQIAPRWVAKKVYEDSLRKNIDPALIEKVWLNSYSLRVFPVLSKTNSKTNWKQKVEVKVLSPIWENEDILYSPKLSFINLKTNKNSSFLSKVYNQEEFIKEDVIKNDKLEDYINSNHTLKYSDLKLEKSDKLTDYCISKDLIWESEKDYWISKIDNSDCKNILSSIEEHLIDNDRWWSQFIPSNYDDNRIWWIQTEKYLLNNWDEFDNTMNWCADSCKNKWYTYALAQTNSWPYWDIYCDCSNLEYEKVETDFDYTDSLIWIVDWLEWFHPMKVNINNSNIVNRCAWQTIKENSEKNIKLEKLKENLSSLNLYSNWSSQIKNKTNIFFDNSASVEKKDANNLYEKIYNSFKNYDWKLNDVNIFSYNFEVEKLADLDSIKYWWYSDINRAIDYVVNNNIKNENIIFVTDDSSFNFSEVTTTDRNLENLLSNNISVIKIWKDIKRYKSDFNNLVSASYWNIYTINSFEEINDVIESIKSTKKEEINKDTCKEILNTNNELKQLQGWLISNMLLSSIKNSNDWQNIAETQTFISNNYNIVNQFNSLIAVETEQQKQDLEIYKNDENIKYKDDYENYGWNYLNSFIGDNNSFSNSVSWNFWSNQSNSGNFGSIQDIDTRLVWATSNWFWAKFRRYNSGYWFRWSTEVSIFWFFVILIYLFQYLLLIDFIMKYFKNDK